jgi:hypothetical protein
LDVQNDKSKFIKSKQSSMFIVKKIKDIHQIGSVTPVNYCLFKIDRDGNSTLLGKYQNYQESLRKMKLLETHNENKRNWKFQDNSFNNSVHKNGWDANYTLKMMNDFE